MKYLSLLLCILCCAGIAITFCSGSTEHQIDRRKLSVQNPIPTLWSEKSRVRREAHREPLGSQASPFAPPDPEEYQPPRRSSPYKSSSRRRPSERLQKRTKKKTRKSGNEWKPVYEDEEEDHVEEVEEVEPNKPPLLNPAHDVSINQVLKGVRFAGKIALRLLQSVRITNGDEDDSNEVQHQRRSRGRRH